MIEIIIVSLMVGFGVQTAFDFNKRERPPTTHHDKKLSEILKNAKTQQTSKE